MIRGYQGLLTRTPPSARLLLLLKSSSVRSASSVAITQLRLVSDSQAVGFLSSVSNTYSDRFTHQLEIFAPTEIWQFNLRYLAFDDAADLLDGIQALFYSATPSTINTGSGSKRSVVEQLALDSNVDTSHSFAIGTFLAGMQGTSSDIYDLNVSTVVGSTSQLNISLSVSSQP